MARRIGIYAICVFFIVFVLQIIGQKFFLFITISWFDNVMHTLGGLCTAFFFIALSYCFYSEQKKSAIFIVAMLSALIIGTTWEIMQFHYIWMRNVAGYMIEDTITDIVFDLLGGFLAYRYVFYIISKNKDN